MTAVVPEPRPCMDVWLSPGRPHPAHVWGHSDQCACPGLAYTRQEAALASFLAADERLSALRGHSGEHLRRAAFDVLRAVPVPAPYDGTDQIDRAVAYWLKEQFRAGFEGRLRRHVASALALSEPGPDARADAPSGRS